MDDRRVRRRHWSHTLTPNQDHSESQVEVDFEDEFTPENTYLYRGHRHCRACWKGRQG